MVRSSDWRKQRCRAKAASGHGRLRRAAERPRRDKHRGLPAPTSGAETRPPPVHFRHSCAARQPHLVPWVAATTGGAARRPADPELSARGSGGTNAVSLHQPAFRGLIMARHSTVRRVEEFVLFDVLYEDGSRTSNRKVPARNRAASMETFPPRPISRPWTGKLPRPPENPGLRSSP